MTIERHYSGVEVRAEGRRLIGPAIQYGEVSPSHRERFEPGAFKLDASTRWLDVSHDRERVIAHTDGGGLELTDGRKALEVRATLAAIPAADRALAAVHAGTLRGFSIEFNSISERRESGIRVIEAAELQGIGLVRSPSYAGSIAEVRAGFATGLIPYNKPLSCDCHKGTCDIVNIEKIELAADRDILAVAGNYSRAVASVSKGSLILEQTGDGLSLGLTAAAFNTPAGRELVEQSEAVPIYARPIYDQEKSTFTESGKLATYSNMVVKGVLIQSTDNAGGWPELKIGIGESEAQRSESKPQPGPAKAAGSFPWLL